MYNVNARGSSHLDRLSYYLNWELSASTWYFLSFAYGFLLYAAVAAAVVFTPYMLYVLFIEKKTGWLIFFFIIVILPLILISIFFSGTIYFSVMKLVPLAFYFFYCFLLKVSAKEWATERRFMMERLYRNPNQ